MVFSALVQDTGDFQLQYQDAVRDISERLQESNEHPRHEEYFYIVGSVLHFFCNDDDIGDSITTAAFQHAAGEVWTMIEKQEEQWELGPDREEAHWLAIRLIASVLALLFPDEYYTVPLSFSSLHSRPHNGLP